MIIGIILAAGEGTRMGLKTVSKTTINFEGKPLIQYGADLFAKCTDKTYVVVGAYSESVKSTLSEYKNIEYVEQTERKGTGHALITAIEQIKKDNLNPEMILLGYGDHMMFYTEDVFKNLIEMHRKNNSVISLISTEYDDPDYIAWGRIIRDENGQLVNIIEQNDATPEQRKIKESNAGFYSMSYQFLIKTIDTIMASKNSGEYYVNDFTYLALKMGENVSVLQVPFGQVGIGINTNDQFEQSSKFFKLAKQN